MCAKEFVNVQKSCKLDCGKCVCMSVFVIGEVRVCDVVVIELGEVSHADTPFCEGKEESAVSSVSLYRYWGHSCRPHGPMCPTQRKMCHQEDKPGEMEHEYG